MQSKCEKRQGGDVAVGWGRRKKQMLQKREKKIIFKERDGVENPGDGAAGALVFLGINVTELLLDQGRHREPMSSRGYSLFLHLSLSLF